MFTSFVKGCHGCTTTRGPLGRFPSFNVRTENHRPPPLPPPPHIPGTLALLTEDGGNQKCATAVLAQTQTSKACFEVLGGVSLICSMCLIAID